MPEHGNAAARAIASPNRQQTTSRQDQQAQVPSASRRRRQDDREQPTSGEADRERAAVAISSGNNSLTTADRPTQGPPLRRPLSCLEPVAQPAPHRQRHAEVHRAALVAGDDRPRRTGSRPGRRSSAGRPAGTCANRSTVVAAGSASVCWSSSYCSPTWRSVAAKVMPSLGPPAERAARRPLGRLRRAQPVERRRRARAAHLGVGVGERAVEAELRRTSSCAASSIPCASIASMFCRWRTLTPVVTLVIAFSTWLSNAVSEKLDAVARAASRSPPRTLRAARCRARRWRWWSPGTPRTGGRAR